MLQLKNVSKIFGQKIVAQDIDLSVKNGQLTALLGASGSGKSTLLNMIAGLIQPDKGEIILNHVYQNNLPPEQRYIAMMFQDFALLPHLNVWENVAFGLRLRGMNKTQAKQIALSLLNEVGLLDAKERKIDALSGGEKQRVALARALAGSPKLLLLDEPFSSLDTALRGQLQQLTRQLVRQRNIPAVLVTHDPKEACFMASDMAILVSGKIVQQDNINQILARPNCPQVAQLLGAINVNEQRYIPQHAIYFNHLNGIECLILEHSPQPECWQIRFHHPTWGELIGISPIAISKKSCRIWVDEAHIVLF